MLKFFRNQKNSWLMKGILTLTALSFVSLFGLSRTIERIPEEGKAIASVGGKKITVARYINELTKQIRMIGKTTGKPFSMKDAIEDNLLESQLDSMITRATMERTTELLKLTVSDGDVRDEIKKKKGFQGLDGSFNMAFYKQYLSHLGISEKEFVDDIFLEMRMKQLNQAASLLSDVSQEMAEWHYRLQNEKRSVDMFTIKPSGLKIAGRPTAQEKEALYKEMADGLMSPEYRSFTVMTLTMDDVAGKITLSEEELKKEFEENRADYITEEIRNIDQMQFSSKEAADNAYAALQSGRKFMDVAKNVAHQNEEQTKLGDLTPSMATEDWADIVFSAKKGEIIPPVQTAFGWQILRVNKITPKVERSFKEVRNEIREKLVSAMAFDTLTETAVALDDRFGAGETIEEVAGSTGFPVRKYTLVDLTGTDENGRKIDVPKAVLATAFLQETGKESPMTEDGSGFFVLRVDDVRDPAVKPLEKSETEIQAVWLSGKQRERTKELADEIEKLLNKGVPLKVISQKTGVPYKRLNGITRKDKTLSEKFVTQLFNRPVNTVVEQIADDEILVAKTVSVMAADPKKDPVGVAKLREELKVSLAQEKESDILFDFSLDFNPKIHEMVARKVFSYLEKSVRDREED